MDCLCCSLNHPIRTTTPSLLLHVVSFADAFPIPLVFCNVSANNRLNQLQIKKKQLQNPFQFSLMRMPKDQWSGHPASSVHSLNFSSLSPGLARRRLSNNEINGNVNVVCLWFGLSVIIQSGSSVTPEFLWGTLNITLMEREVPRYCTKLIFYNKRDAGRRCRRRNVQ